MVSSTPWPGYRSHSLSLRASSRPTCHTKTSPLRPPPPQLPPGHPAAVSAKYPHHRLRRLPLAPPYHHHLLCHHRHLLQQHPHAPSPHRAQPHHPAAVPPPVPAPTHQPAPRLPADPHAAAPTLVAQSYAGARLRRGNP